jgi:hypothetical protein
MHVVKQETLGAFKQKCKATAGFDWMESNRIRQIEIRRPKMHTGDRR